MVLRLKFKANKKSAFILLFFSSSKHTLTNYKYNYADKRKFINFYNMPQINANQLSTFLRLTFVFFFQLFLFVCFIIFKNPKFHSLIRLTSYIIRLIQSVCLRHICRRISTKVNKIIMSFERLEL